MLRSYLKTLARRVWQILRRPVTRFFSGAVTVFTLLAFFNQPVMDSIVSAWQGISPWWGLLPLGLLVAYALIKAGYELWKEERDAHEKAQGQLGVSEEKRKELESKLVETQAEGGSGLGYDKLVAELERVRGERDEYEKELTIRKQKEPLRDWYLKNEAKWEYLREANLPEIEEAKQRCLELADELYQFLEERGHKETDDLQDPQVQQRSAETVELYRKCFMDKVYELRTDLEQCKLWGDGVVDLQWQDIAKNPPNYLTICAIAGHLSAIANRL